MIKPVKAFFNGRAYVYRFHGFTMYSKIKLNYAGMLFKYTEAIKALSFEATDDNVSEEELIKSNKPL